VYQLHPSQRTKSQADRWVQAHLKTVADAENDPILGNRFRLSIEEKEFFEVFTTINWQTAAGGEDGITFATKYALEVISPDSKWSPKAQKHARNWLIWHQATPDVASKKSIISRFYERLIRDGAKETSVAILSKIRRWFNASSVSKQDEVKLPDINWWANAK
jgi:hypothetical protein